MPDDRIPLSQLLDLVNAEIRAAHESATSAGHHAVMQFEGCELEFAIDVEAKAGGGFHVWVMKLGGGVKRTESNTIKVRYSALGKFVAAAEGLPGAITEHARTGVEESP